MRSSVANCVITQTGWDSVDSGALNLTNWDASSSDRTLVNTVIAGNLGLGIEAHITGTVAAHWRMINTTIAQNVDPIETPLQAIDVFTLDTGYLTGHVYNSILWAGSPAGEAVRFYGAIQFTVDHNDCGTVDLSGGAGWLAGTGMLSVAPLFVAAGSGDFHLQVGSPLIDKGETAGVSPLDADGRPRVTGGFVDLGAYEGSSWRSGEVDFGSGWKWTSWFGIYNTNFAPWVYHQQHGFLYPYDNGNGAVFFWYNDMQQFVWTTPTTYPFLYRFGADPAWLWYLKDSANPRLFYNYTAGGWESLP